MPISADFSDAEIATGQEGSDEVLFARSAEVIPGGVNSPVRAYGSVGGAPSFVNRAAGAYVYDEAGHEFVDLVASWGPALLGHAHPEVVTAVQDAAARGLSFGAPTAAETQLAEAIVSRLNSVLPDNDPIIDRVRLVSTGTEATMTAIRLARGATGRDLLVKFAGHYHGHSDGLLAEAGSGVATLALPSSAGVPSSVASQTLVVPYNDLAALKQAFTEFGDQIAAVIVEASAANMGVVAPDAGFNAAVCELAHSNGSLVIFDEVLTGFRVHPAGFWGLQAQRGEVFRPDLFTFGKVIGGGMPLAALAGKAELMDHLAPLGPVYQAGTLSGNPLSVAAGLATLRLADAEVYERVDEAAEFLVLRLREAFAEAGLRAVVAQSGSLFSPMFGVDAPPRSYAEMQATEHWRYPAFFHAMRDAGVLLPPSAFEAWFVTAAHDQVALAKIADAFPAAVAAAASATNPS